MFKERLLDDAIRIIKKRTITSILILQKKYLTTVKKSNPSFAFLLHLNIGDVALPPPCLNMYVRMQKSMDLIW